MGEPTGRSIFCSSRPYFGNNAPSSDNRRPDTLQIIEKKCAKPRHFWPRIGLWLIAAATFSGCKSADQGPSAPPMAAQAEVTLQCGSEGKLQGRLYGAIGVQLDWDEHELECSGMPRPEGRGARLRFAGPLPDNDRSIAIIIAIPDLGREALGNEYRSNVTVIEEGNGRFFSTPDLDNCLTDITKLDALDDGGDSYSPGGLLYCVSPLPEVNGDSSISIPEVRFQGLLDWSSS